MSNQGLTPKEAKIAENVLACVQYVQRLAFGFARKGHGFEIHIYGKGDGVLHVKYGVDVGPIAPEKTVM